MVKTEEILRFEENPEKSGKKSGKRMKFRKRGKKTIKISVTRYKRTK